jgi:hypothetical protein
MISAGTRWPMRAGVALTCVGLAGFAAAAALVPLDNNDVWIHLTTGRLILEEGAVPTADRYSFTAAGNRYVAHEWLAAVLYALGERAAGAPGVVAVGKVLPALALVAALLAAVAATGAPWGRALPVPLLALTVFRRRIVARPELLALPLLLAALALLHRDRRAARAGRRTRAVYWLVPIELVWVNLHGSFPLGIALVLVFALVEVAEELLAPRDRRAALVRAGGVAVAVAAAAWLAGRSPSAFGMAAAAAVAGTALLFAFDGYRPLFRPRPSSALRSSPRLLAVAALMALAVSINPLGAEIYTFPFEFTAADNPITSGVNEWKPLLAADHLSGSLALPAYCAYLALWCAALAIGAWRRRLGMLELGLLLLLGILPLRHSRWMGLFALGTTPALVAALAAASVSGVAPGSHPRRRVAAAVIGVAGAVFLALGVGVAVRGGVDPVLWATLLVAGASASVAALLAARPRLSPTLGTGAAAAAALGLALLSASHGVPEFSGVEPRGWSAAAVGPGFGRSLYGKGATDLMRREGVAGRLFTEYEWAGYAIHQLWPEVTVFIDSRSEVYGEALLTEFRRVKGDRDAARTALQEHGVDLVLVRHQPYPAERKTNRGVLDAVESDREWELLYVDDRAILYARRGLDRRLPAGFAVFEPHRFRVGGPGGGRAELEAELRRALDLAPDSAFLHFALAESLIVRGRLAEALSELEAGWAANPAYLANGQRAGEIAAALGRPQEARRWFLRVLAAAPEWERPRRALEELEE